ncbi:MAG: class I SAM-dependent methyltransferase [Desulforhabdus sp.]|jgi:predicted O-methyltransferase YrrM|nr:class I SAM-dependent methyltransferase [Desulforhabdus sp.]
MAAFLGTSFLALALIALALKARNWANIIFREQCTIKTELQELKFNNIKTLDSISRQLVNLNQETVNAASLNALNLNFPVFFGEWSIDTHQCRILVNTILEKRPKCIVELGSGTSTIVIAKVLKLLGLTATFHATIDHEEKYLNITREIAKLNELDSNIHFIHSPLAFNNKHNQLWYSDLIEKIGENKIDLLIIDGPPGPLQKNSRYPAIPELRASLNADTTIILDDANRPDEKNIIDQWLKEFSGFEVEYRQEGHGTAIFRRTRNQDL